MRLSISKLIAVAALAGLMMTVAILSALSDRPRAPVQPELHPAPAFSDDRLAREMDRCRTLTMPDAGCEAAWEASRRRFLGQDMTDVEIAPDAKVGSAGAAAHAPETIGGGAAPIVEASGHDE